MPSYNKSPFAAQPQKLIPGQPAYLFGSWPQDQAPTKGQVNNVALASNVATVTVTINEGNIPAVGSLITIIGTASTSGLLNVTNVALTGVTITASTGAGTLTFALTHANVASAADGGMFIIPAPETNEAVANGASLPVGLPYTSPFTTESNVEAVQCEVNFPALPTACVVALQGAMTNVDANYQPVIANVVTVSAGVATYGTLQATGKWNFLRYSISGTSGSGTIVAKVGI